MLTRRGLLLGALAAGIAPAAIRPGVLMPVRALWVPRARPVLVNGRYIIMVHPSWMEDMRAEASGYGPAADLVRGELITLESSFRIIEAASIL